MTVIGHATCSACGSVSVMAVPVCRLNTGVDTCEDCGEDALTVAVWFDAAVFPDVAAIVAFDRARRALQLPALTCGAWQ